VIQVDVVELRPGDSNPRGRLVLNGRLIEKSWAIQSHGRVDAAVRDTEAVTVLLECRLYEIRHHFDFIRLPLLERASDYLDSFAFKAGEDDEIGSFELDFVRNMDLEDWAKPWSFIDFLSMVHGLIDDRDIPGFSYPWWNTHSPDSIILKVKLHEFEETVQHVLEHWLPVVRDVLEEAEATLTANAHKGALVALFQFAPEVKTACEQYLLYFVQFLQDLGISATADLQEQARVVLFTVTPQSGSEALERIREALEVYLRMPQSPDFDTEVARHADIAVQQYAANVLHLRSQLTLAKAVLEAKDATIEALQAVNLQYKQLLAVNPQSQGQLAGSGAGNAQGDETILGDTVTITKYKGKGFEVNLPLIFRMLKRTFKREG